LFYDLRKSFIFTVALQNTYTVSMIAYTEGIYTFYVYILTNKTRSVLYTGVTNNIKKRLQQHQEKLNPKSFTSRYNVEYLLYFEKFTWIQLAIEREKEIKNLSRAKKLDLIREQNPNLDFYNAHFGISSE
jgi:putative endonuclease